MPHKLKRRGSNVFHRKRVPVKAIAWSVGAVLLVLFSYMGTKYILEDLPKKQEGSSSSTTSATKPPATTSTTSPADTSEPVTDPGKEIRGVYVLPKLFKEEAALDTTIAEAKKAGMNAFIFDLKNEQGRLLYQSATEIALDIKSAEENALPLDTLQSAVAKMKKQGIKPVARLYAFQDPYAPQRLQTARIYTDGPGGATWHDDDPRKGGKAWLNPYKEDAHRYVIELIQEIQDAGIDTVMLDGVQFPNKTYRAYFGNTKLSWSEILQQFITKAQTSMGEGKLILSTPGLAAVGDGSTPFGGSPVILGESAIAPKLMPSTLGKKLRFGDTELVNPVSKPYEAVKITLEQIKLRISLMEEAKRPAVIPWIQAEDYTAAQLKEQMRAVIEVMGDKAAYIVYHSDGSYPFGELD